MVADPRLMPFTFGITAGVVEPAGTKILRGVTVMVSVLLLVRPMNTPPAGAGAPKAIGYRTERPGATVAPVGKTIPLKLVRENVAGFATPAAVALTW